MDSRKRKLKTGVCLGGKLSPFSDISQNSTLEKRLFTKFNVRKTNSSQNSIWRKRTLHKIQYEKNGLFTKFNSVHIYVFRRAPHLPPIFLEIKNVHCHFLEVKNKPFPFYFLLPISRESIVLGSNFQSGDFDGFTCFDVPWIRKSHF